MAELTEESGMVIMSDFILHILDRYSTHNQITPSRIDLAVIGSTIIEGVVYVNPTRFMLELSSITGTNTCQDVTEMMWQALRGLNKSIK